VAACLLCESIPPFTGYLCEECANAIHGASHLFPEQVTTTVASASDAVLVDRWGRAHSLASRTLLGRQPDPDSIAIIEASVSRRHAEILRKPDGQWWLIDLVSSNGTYFDDQVVTSPVRLTSRKIIFVGEVGLLFIAPRPTTPPAPVRLPATHRPGAKLARPMSTAHHAPASSREAEMVVQQLSSESAEEEEDDHPTFLGLRAVDLALASPSGGGGGFVEVDGRSAQLTTVQYEFVKVLAERMFAEVGRDERVRGFVRSSELLASIPWDTGRPDDNHIKQLVRRVRRTLVRAQIGDLIEARHGFGYRLRVRVEKAPHRE